MLKLTPIHPVAVNPGFFCRMNPHAMSRSAILCLGLRAAVIQSAGRRSGEADSLTCSARCTVGALMVRIGRRSVTTCNPLCSFPCNLSATYNKGVWSYCSADFQSPALTLQNTFPDHVHPLRAHCRSFRRPGSGEPHHNTRSRGRFCRPTDPYGPGFRDRRHAVCS